MSKKNYKREMKEERSIHKVFRKKAMHEAIFMDFDLIRWKNADAVKVQRYAKAPENYYFFFSSFFRDALTILFFHFVSLSHFFFFSRNTNYAYYLDEMVGFKILKETNCPFRRVWKYQVFFSLFFFLATLENRPLLEPLICLILSKKLYVKLLKNLSRSLARALKLFLF